MRVSPKTVQDDVRHGGVKNNASFQEATALGTLDRNSRTVWPMATESFTGAHFATFPQELPRRCIKAGTRIYETVLDPFGGAGTTALVADQLARDCILIELNPEYAKMAERRIIDAAPLFARVSVE